jgi:trimeric autotransporter adhesin
VEEIMPRRFSWIAVGFLTVLQLGCGGTAFKQSPKPDSSGTPSVNISVSPASATAGSPDVTLTISALNNFAFHNGIWHSNVLWSQGGVDTPLLATFVSSSQLTAVVPAALMVDAVTAKVRVEIWDNVEGTRVATSSSVPFRVSSTSITSIATPSISSISPSTASAGSPDVTITIDGANFGHYGHFVWSTAFWTTDGNLHDHGTMLQTTIVSSSQVTAVIPASILQSPTSVQILVMNGDVMGMSDGYFGYPRSNSVTFTVTP